MLPTQPVRAVFQEMQQQQKWDCSGLHLIPCAPDPQRGATKLCTQIAVFSTADQWQLVKRQHIRLSIYVATFLHTRSSCWLPCLLYTFSSCESCPKSIEICRQTMQGSKLKADLFQYVVMVVILKWCLKQSHYQKNHIF